MGVVLILRHSCRGFEAAAGIVVAGSHFETEAEVVVGIAEDLPCSSSEADSREGNNSAVEAVV